MGVSRVSVSWVVGVQLVLMVVVSLLEEVSLILMEVVPLVWTAVLLMLLMGVFIVEELADTNT